jgi:aminoglycoside phosphotransferase (APT) family kinase protein
VHGDLSLGNVIVRGGKLAGVIDWSATGVGDPVCEVMLAWSFPADGRAVYREALGVDEARWTRARGWSAYGAGLFIPYYERTIPDGVIVAKRRLEAILHEFEAGEGRSLG